MKRREDIFPLYRSFPFIVVLTWLHNLESSLTKTTSEKRESVELAKQQTGQLLGTKQSVFVAPTK